MAEEIAVGVLRHRYPEVDSENDVRDRSVLFAEVVDGKASDEHEPSPSVELVCPAVDRACESRQWYLVSVQLGEGSAGGPHDVDGVDELVYLRLGELMDPLPSANQVDATPRRPVRRCHAQQVEAAGSPSVCCGSVAQHPPSDVITGASARTV